MFVSSGTGRLPAAIPADAGSARPRVALVINIPAPYRVPVFNHIARDGRIDLTVLFCAGREPDREWDFDSFEFKYAFLKESFQRVGGRFVHNNPDVLQRLRAIDPHVVIGTNFHPTCMYAFGWTWYHKRKYVVMTDSTTDSERALSAGHKAARRVVYKRSVAFVGASNGSEDLYRLYGVPPQRFFKSHLCVDNASFDVGPNVNRQYDLLFSGRLVSDKSPHFALDVAERLAASLGRTVSILIAGSGPLEAELRARASQCTNVDARFAGFVSQRELPGVYASARVFLFPTKNDVWGVVANEACASGLPIVSTPFSGAVGEIILDGTNGFVRAFDVSAWAAAVQRLLSDDGLYRTFSQNSRKLVADYSYANAASGLINAALLGMREYKGDVAVTRFTRERGLTSHAE